MNKSDKFILWFDEIGIDDVSLVGGKNASLGEMYRNLTKKGVNIPYGFTITSTAYKYLIEKTGIKNEIKRLLSGLDVKNIKELETRGRKIRELFLKIDFPDDLKKDIIEAYKKLCKIYKTKDTDVAVRSSATAEDLPTASFAGQQETYLNIRGPYQLIDACKKCFASLFTNRAISYRVDKGFDHLKVYLSIGVQKMVRSDLASSGVMFTIDTETGFDNVVFITSIYGLGENIVQGTVNPDEYYVFKPTLKKGYKPIIYKKVGTKDMKLIYSNEGNKTTKNIPVPEKDRKRYVLNDKEILKLAEWGMIIEEHYTKKHKRYTPMDIEWAKDGQLNQLFIVQARPETVQSQKKRNILKEYVLRQKGDIIVKGLSVGSKIGQGRANVIKDIRDIRRFNKGDILITNMTDPDWEPIMKIASGIVTNEGGRTCFTGDTKVLTNKGFMTFREIFNSYDKENLMVLSLNKETLKTEWKPIIDSMKRKSKVIKVSISQTGRIDNNYLKLTPDHKMLTYINRKLEEVEIKDIIKNKQMIILIQKIPSLAESSLKDQKLAYLLGAISTDGSIYLTNRHGEVQFIQKPTKEKKQFIDGVINYMFDVFNKKVSISKKKNYVGVIRGGYVLGNANAYRFYGKQIATQMLEYQQKLVQMLLTADNNLILNFLAGVIDGDGTYDYKNNRINIYCSKEFLMQAIIVGCLRLGIVPQVTTNRNIYNIQIVEKIDLLLSYTKRVKGDYNRKSMGTRFFSAKQLFNDVDDKINFKARIKPYINKNLLIDSNKINNILHIYDINHDINHDIKQDITNILNSDTRMQRVKYIKDLGEDYVYNITVKDNHNYIIFTNKYTPVLVSNCHAAIVARELGIPCIVGTNNATEKIKTGRNITVSCAEGEIGYVYDGLLKYDVVEHDLTKIPKTKTKIMMNIGNPEEAFELSFLPVDGVGLAREEFIINSYIKIHPNALIKYNKLPKDIKEKIDNLTFNYKDKKKFFVDRLSQGIAMIASSFYPKEVIVRFSDFKSNEYANLIGGKLFEPKEDNPMIGFRGASRYYSEKFRESFSLECKAIKKVREEFGLKNVSVMVPFCRTVEEGKKVIKEIKRNGIDRKNIKIYVMCEIPSNVLLADKFLDIFDGFSIGTNDLTQLTLGVDRDSELVAHDYDERNEAVKKLVGNVIDIANKKKKYIGICGDAPSTYPEFAEWLVKKRIKSISLSPDAVLKTRLVVARKEKRIK